VNGGYCFPCNPEGDPEQLGEHFRKIGEQMRLRTKGDVAGAEKLLEYMQTIPWDMTVAERVPSPHCLSQSQGSEGVKQRELATHRSRDDGRLPTVTYPGPILFIF
jgi:hypothetical protein